MYVVHTWSLEWIKRKLKEEEELEEREELEKFDRTLPDQHYADQNLQ